MQAVPTTVNITNPSGADRSYVQTWAPSGTSLNRDCFERMTRCANERALAVHMNCALQMTRWSHIVDDYTRSVSVVGTS